MLTTEAKSERDQLIQHLQDTIVSPDQLATWILDHQDLIMKKVWCARHQRYEFGKDFRLLTLKFEIMDVGQISCTHSAPKGKPTNFYMLPSLPSHYFGFRGQMNGTLKGRYPSFLSNLFEPLGIATGSGGGSKDFSYTYTLWGDDWPAMTEHYRLQSFEAKIRGR